MALIQIQTLLEIALQLERSGVAFFNHWAEKTESEELKNIFTMLAEEEEEHIRDFMKIASEQKEIENEIEISKKLKDFYKMFSETILYNNDEFESIKDVNQALIIAKKQEIDSQLFYSELRKYINKDYLGIVDKIISEEEKHYKKISDLQKSLKLR